MIQSTKELEDWYSQNDPWGYYNNVEDKIRKEKILSSIPKLEYENVLDIGCGNGFITSSLPGKNIYGIEISEKAVAWANENSRPNTKYICGSIFDLPSLELPPMNLIVITGVLYPQYISSSIRLIYLLIDELLAANGVLLCSHIFDWYKSRFPYLTISREYFPYREYSQILEVYIK
jgi:2-polyprenyl-3-methyl-5-hydroxy-6-metoxy-1,4-benzoquinol methylase